MASKESSLATTTPMPGWGLWFLWVLVHIVGYLIGVGVYRAVASFSLPMYQNEQFTVRAYGYELWAIGAGVLAGILTIAVGQGAHLWHYIPRINMLRWAFVTSLAYMVGFLVLGSYIAFRLLSPANNTYDRPTDSEGLGEQFRIACFFLTLVGGVGFFAGLVQGKLLAKHDLKQGVWAFANAISLITFTVVFALIVAFRVFWVNMNETLLFFVGAGIGGTLASAITGFELLRILRQPPPTIQEEQSY